jgi:hypothetical protein
VLADGLSEINIFSFYSMRWLMPGSTLVNIFGLFLASSLLVTLLTDISRAEPNPEKIENIKKLLLVSGIKDQLSYMKDGVMNSYSQMIGSAYPKVPDAFWTDFNTLIGDRDMDALIDQVIPVYDKHMSNDVIIKLIEMLETPFWREWKEKMPLISREAGMAGQKWIHELTQADDFKKKIDRLVKKHELEKLNPPKKDSK